MAFTNVNEEVMLSADDLEAVCGGVSVNLEVKRKIDFTIRYALKSGADPKNIKSILSEKILDRYGETFLSDHSSTMNILLAEGIRDCEESLMTGGIFQIYRESI